jgi:hypothetical protein
MTILKNIRTYVALLAVAGVSFVLGLTGGSNTATVDVQTVAGELTPGPYGSGVLGDWTTLSHGVYCFTNGSLTSSSVAKTTTTAWKNYAKTLSSVAQNVPSQWCPNEQVRLYGDSITFGGKSAFAAALNNKVVVVDAWSGRPTTPVADNIEAANWLPATVVVASGTNDIFNPTVMATQINRIKAKIANLNATRTDGITTKLFWVDTQITRWSQTDLIERNDQRNAMAINYAIWNNLDKNQIIQWSARFLQNPGLLTTYLQDGVHPKTGTGYAYWAATVKSWLTLYGGI